MTRTDLMRKINDMMTAAGATLTEDQDAVLAAALAVLLPEYLQHERKASAAIGSPEDSRK